jgi:alginate O-acetyltransferase complex protein AlgI
MSIVSLKFFIFILITLVTYYICVPKLRWIVILTANIGFFLAISNLSLFVVFSAMTLATWIAALLLKNTVSEKTRTVITTVTIISLVITLIFYKELSFFIINTSLLEKLTGINGQWNLPEFVAPLGISYFTLILIGYLLDVRWGTVPSPQKNPLKMLAFVGYFPHMTSGPFSRYNDVSPTMFGDVKFKFSNIWSGLQRIIWGVFKVLVISTRLSVLVATIYDAQSLPISENHFTGFAIVGGALLYVLNVYMNFSGSMDIIIGVSEMFGIPVAENFQRPFSATSLSGVWRRWHMTLGFWLKDYVLYPTLKSEWMNKIRVYCKTHFGKKAANDIPTYIGMLITWFCVGFWHGGSWKFIFGSGIFFFVMIVGGLILAPSFKRIIKLFRINTDCISWRLFQRLRTFFLFSFSVSFGRAASLTAGLKMWKTSFTTLNTQMFFDGTIFKMGLSQKDLIFAVLGLSLVLLVSHLQEHFGSVRELIAKQNVLFRILVIVLLFAATFLIGGMDNKIDFIYGNF